MPQIAMFDDDESRRERDKAIDRVAQSNDEWLPFAASAIRKVARRQETLTTDDVWLVLVKAGVKPPREPRALGPAMLEAQTDGVIARTGKHENSQRVACHSRPLRIWKSLTFKETA